MQRYNNTFTMKKKFLKTMMPKTKVLVIVNIHIQMKKQFQIKIAF
jgi:hypothetical protein